LVKLKRLKRLRWYKVAKLMGEGATAKSCHDRWVELTEVKETPIERETRQKKDEALNVWSEYEVKYAPFPHFESSQNTSSPSLSHYLCIFPPSFFPTILHAPQIACLTTSVQRNIKEDGSIDWVRVGKELGLEGFVCEKKHNALLAEAAEAERAQLEAETAVLAEGEDFWSSQDGDNEDAGDVEEEEEED